MIIKKYYLSIDAHITSINVKKTFNIHINLFNDIILIDWKF